MNELNDGITFSHSPKKIFQKTILNLKFKIPANNSKVQDSFFRMLILAIWRFEKRIAPLA